MLPFSLSGGSGPLAQVSISLKGRCELGAGDNARGASRCEWVRSSASARDASRSSGCECEWCE
eukprot:scaffold60893_cov59-Cyclotella_meneghiniana.AAC.6